MQATHSPSASNPELNSIVASASDQLLQAITAKFSSPVLAEALDDADVDVLGVADALDVAARALADLLHEHAASIRKRENETLPFYTLPVELLILVVRYAVINQHYNIKTLVTLTWVSSRLREVLVAERSLWTSIEWDAPQHMVSLALQRSHPHCVEVTVDGWEDTPDEERIESPLLQEVLAEPARLKSANFNILQKSYPRIPPLTSDVFPHLTSFSLVIIPDRPDGGRVRPLQPISLIGPPPPGLRRLRIKGLTVELIPSVWWALELLCLVDTGINTTAILEVLRHCHHLRHLEVIGDVVVSPMLEDHLVVTSESITRVVFDGKSAQFLPNILPFVTFPNCLSFFVILGSESSGTLSPNAVAASAYTRRAMLVCQSAEHPNTFSTNVHNAAFMLSLERKDVNNGRKYLLEVFIPSTYRLLPQWLVGLFAVNPLIHGCHCRIALNTPIPDYEDDEDDEGDEGIEYDDHECAGSEGCNIDEVSLHPILTLNGVFSIAVDDLSIYGTSPFGIYRAMSQPLPGGLWLLPAVRTLSIVGPADVDLTPLLDLLRAPVGQMGFPGGVRRFQTINLPPRFQGTRWEEAIRRITGPGTNVAFNPS